MLLSADSARLILSARCRYVAVALALEAEGHGALTMEKFAVFWLVVMD